MSDLSKGVFEVEGLYYIMNEDKYKSANRDIYDYVGVGYCVQITVIINKKAKVSRFS